MHFFVLLVVCTTDDCNFPSYWKILAINSGSVVPRYFFNVLHHSSGLDSEGADLPDIYAAQAEAVRLCGELIKEIAQKFWEEPLWRLEVTNHEKRCLFTLTFSAIEHAS